MVVQPSIRINSIPNSVFSKAFNNMLTDIPSRREQEGLLAIYASFVTTPGQRKPDNTSRPVHSKQLKSTKKDTFVIYL
jgi:hypothetical protein